MNLNTVSPNTSSAKDIVISAPNEEGYRNIVTTEETTVLSTTWIRRRRNEGAT